MNSEQESTYPFPLYEVATEVNGVSFFAKRIVLARGWGSPSQPQWVTEALKLPNTVVRDALHVESTKGEDEGEAFRAASSKGNKRILVIGAGMTGCSLALREAKSRTSEVTLVARNGLRVQPYDLSTKWVGRASSRHMMQFYQQHPDERHNTMKEARGKGHGTACPETVKRIRSAAECASTPLSLVEGVAVTRIEATCNRDAALVTYSDGSCAEFDFVWICTGRGLDVRKDVLMSQLCKRINADCTSDGTLPVLEEDLRLSSEHNVFIMGAYASLQLGPDAHNISSARRASRLIIESILEDCQTDGDDNDEEEGDESSSVEHDNPFHLLCLA